MPVNPIYLNRLARPVEPVKPPISIRIQTPTQFVDGVFEGGGALGAAYTGSLTLLQAARIWFKRVAGNSAGAITAAMVAAGYSATDIEWLTSSFSDPRVSRPSTMPAGVVPISFMKFLDFPTVDSISTASKRKTLLWNVLKGQALDQLLETKIPTPTRKDVEDEIVKSLKVLIDAGSIVNNNFEDSVRQMLATPLSVLPKDSPKLKDFSLFDETASLRRKFADAVWDAVAKKDPFLLMSTQFFYEGSVLEGNEFLTTMEALLRAKIPGTGVVKFQDLPIPLAVIACNYRNKEVIVYSSATHPTMQVAEAVRRSMSIPFVFQPRKVHPQNVGPISSETIVDGGVASNFPVWLLTPAGNQYWPANSVDQNRPKIGFSLEDSKAAPSSWNAAAAKFGNSVQPDEILLAVLIAKLKEIGAFVPTPDYGDQEFQVDLSNYKFLDVLMGYFSIDKELAVRQQVVQGLMSGMPYFDVEIPLRGFHWLDFGINSDRSDMCAIAERGFMAARDALSATPLVGSALVRNPDLLMNPF